LGNLFAYTVVANYFLPLVIFETGFLDHILQDQYLAFVLGPGLSQLCLALNDFRLLGSSLLIDNPVVSPNDTFFTFLVFGSFT